jgi:outer membrane protein OmpA-like peptidoglycan-associated protein
MKTLLLDDRKLLITTLAALLMVACSSGPRNPEAISQLRNDLTQLQSDPQLASKAPVAIADAEKAVVAAETPQQDPEQEAQLIYMADHKVKIARAQAQARNLEDQRSALKKESATARLDSRTQEADTAHQLAKDLQQEIDDLNAKQTDRGLVVTLGDVLFDYDSSTLKAGNQSKLSKLSAFLVKHQDRSVAIEGHTDSVGSDGYNMALSQRRADSVESFLTGQGISPSRLTSQGKGEGFPIVGNQTAAGRQQNRRVEVIINNTLTQ